VVVRFSGGLHQRGVPRGDLEGGLQCDQREPFDVQQAVADANCRVTIFRAAPTLRWGAGKEVRWASMVTKYGWPPE